MVCLTVALASSGHYSLQPKAQTVLWKDFEFSFGFWSFSERVEEHLANISVRRGLSKGVEDGHRPPPGERATPKTIVSGVARRQGIEGLGMVALGETLGSPWPPLAIRPCLQRTGG
jgi:hypothetical protein